MDFSRYEKLRTLVRANFSEQTQHLVDEALEYADAKLAGLVRYDGSPLMDHAVAVASIVISEVGLGRNSAAAASPSVHRTGGPSGRKRRHQSPKRYVGNRSHRRIYTKQR